MGRYKHIYNTLEWQAVRKQVIIRDKGLCKACYKKGTIKRGKEVDHIQELTDLNYNDYDIAYNIDNLQLLCSDCHNQKHDRCTSLQKFVKPL